jgi:hypothetical protein
MFGLFAYPAMGIYQSIVGALKTESQHKVLQARIAHDAYFENLHRPSIEEEREVLRRFQELTT